ncbi:hypothetical protein AC1031_004272 [Aphanomyces cochlioides]|nr:hypothetical protein AC1031_004272 [Aphanomyces cochlioides]
MSPITTKGQPIEILTGSGNYLPWTHETLIYIAGKGLEGHLDGSIEEPTEPEKGPGSPAGVKFVVNKSSSEWREWRKDDMNIGEHVVMAQELWNHISARYGRASGYAKMLAMLDVYNCFMKSDKPVSVYLANISRLVSLTRQYVCNISHEDEAWFVVLNLDAKFTSMPLFHESNERFYDRDVENPKMRIEDEERRLADMNALRRPGNGFQNKDAVLDVTTICCFNCQGFGHRSPECPSTDGFKQDGTPKPKGKKKTKQTNNREFSETQHFRFRFRSDLKFDAGQTCISEGF